MKEETAEKYFGDYLKPVIEDDKKYIDFLRAGGTYTNDASWIDRARDIRAGERFTDQNHLEINNQPVGKTDYFEGDSLQAFKNDYEHRANNYKNGKSAKIIQRVDRLHDFFDRYCDYVEERKADGMTNYPN